MGSVLKLHKSYNFVTKHNVIDELRTAIEDSGMSYKDIERKCGVCASTMSRWFDGKTKRPQTPTLNMVARTVGCRVGLVKL